MSQLSGCLLCTETCVKSLHVADIVFWKHLLVFKSYVVHCCNQAVGLRGYAQRDPLVEYKLEGYNLFLEMMASIRRNTIYNVYMFQPAKVCAAIHALANKLSSTRSSLLL